MCRPAALQDDIVFLTLAAATLWLISGLTAWLALRTRSGLLTALPALWTLSLVLYYGNGQRYILITALALAILLHLWLDQRNLEAEWQRRRIDFSTALIVDRAGVVVGITLLVLLVAWVIPSPRVEATMRWAYERLAPVYAPIEETGKRLFPDLERPLRGHLGSGIGDGLPNRFLLGAGPFLSQIPVMWVGTNRTFTSNLTDFYEEPSLRFYMRRATFADYDGAAIEPTLLTRSSVPAQRNWTDAAWTERVLVRQWVRLAGASTLLYATGEPVEVSINYQTTQRSPVDLVALWADGEPVNRYDVVSAAPSVNEEMLLAWPGFGADRPLPDDLAIHLTLPDTITQRTRDLAAQLVTGQATPYAQARAIEQYLRGFTYDLEVSEPPADVDVADYFLFDLQRGYCDYYATAFVVLARAAGLPARFVTGFVPGGWNPEAQEWVITEAEAHSWPEVYFPDLGWLPFEPTAGRAALTRVDMEGDRAPLSLPLPVAQEPTSAPAAEFTWNWQMLIWLIPLFGLSWLAWRWLRMRRHRDPWQALIRWGRRLGRPYRDVETELEYGRGLAGHIAAGGGEPERARRLSRSVIALTEDVSQARYAREEARGEAAVRATERWREVIGDR
ncbi:MAG: transglutaminase-like domain-containing protein [Caldilineaceae bacterium]